MTIETRKRQRMFVAATALGVLVVCELAFRLLAWASPAVDEAIGRGVPVAVPDPVLGHRPNPTFREHDEAGFRNPLRLSRAPIVVLGDSQSYGHAVAPEHAWPRVLSALSGRAVYNMAFSGWGPVQYLALAEEALALEPELVLVGLYAGNDLRDAFAMTRGAAPFARLRRQDEAVRAAIRRDRAGRPKLGTAWSKTKTRWDATRERGALDRLWRQLRKHSRLAAAANAAHRELAGAGIGLPGARRAHGDDEWAELVRRAGSVDGDWFLPVASGAARTLLSPRARLPALDLSDARVEQGYSVTLRALSELGSRVAPGAALLVVMIPTKERVFYPLAVAQIPDPPPELHALDRAEEIFWARMRSDLDSLGIAWVDGLPALRGAVDRGESPYPMDTNGHPNALGNRILAEVVFESDPVRRIPR